MSVSLRPSKAAARTLVETLVQTGKQAEWRGR